MAKKSIKETLFGAEENSAATIDPAQLQKHKIIAARMYHTPQLSAREMSMPAIARGCRQFSEQVYSSYRGMFLLNILRLDQMYILLIQTLISIYDVLNNPLMGIVYDRTRTRWGKARPYAILTPFFYYASTALLFCGRLIFNNDVPDDPRKILFVFVMMFIRETFSTIYTIPQDNYLTLLSPNPKDRIGAGMWETFAKNRAGDFMSALFMPLWDLSKNGRIDVSLGTLVAVFGVVGSVVGTGGSVMMSLNCRERVMMQPEPANPLKSMFYILKNKYLLRNFIAEFASSWWAKGNDVVPYDTVTQMEILGGVLPTLLFYLPRNIFGFVSLLFVEPFKKMFGGNYRKTIIFMRVWDFVAGLAAATVFLTTKAVNWWWVAGLVFAVTDGLNKANDAPSSVLEDEINREIKDYTEYMTGERPDGTIGMLTDLIKKTMEPFKTIMSFAILRWVKYDPAIGSNKRWTQQLVRDNSEMYSKVLAVYCIGNVAEFFFKMIPLIFYDLEGKKKEEMYVALNERRALIANDDAARGEMAALMEMMEANV